MVADMLRRCFYAIVFLLCLLTRPNLGCPNGCACFASTQVICNLAGLVNIPSDLPITTKYLSLNENQIRRIPTDAFKGLDQLKSIRLDDNNVTEIDQYAFRGLSDMDEITVQNNPLDHLESYSFAELKNIGRIYLGYNKILAIKANTFYDTHNIREIALIGNPIAVIHTFAFRKLSNVQFFYFPKSIHRIEADGFNGLQNVSMLRLESLKTPQLEPHSFRGLANVAGLEIRGSHIGIVHGAAFDGLTNVDYLGVEGNHFGALQRGAFAGMKNIVTLMISANTIDDLEDGAFSELDALKVKKFNFSDNRVPCDCKLHRLDRGLRLLANDAPKVNFCQYPPAVSGQKVGDVELESLEECPTVAPQLAKDSAVDVQSGVNLDVSDVPSIQAKSIENGSSSWKRPATNSDVLGFFLVIVFLVVR